MSKQFDELSKDLANGESRRSAIGRFLAGIGAVAGVLFSRKSAHAEPQAQFCMEFCRTNYEGDAFGLCIAYSNKCPKGTCAYLYPKGANQTTHFPGTLNGSLPGNAYDYFCCPPSGISINSTQPAIPYCRIDTP